MRPLELEFTVNCAPDFAFDTYQSGHSDGISTQRMG
jgi:hypothetical protein